MSNEVTMFARECTDCGMQLLCSSESKLDENVRDHMLNEHVVTYTIPKPDCTDTQPCERARKLIDNG